MILPIYIYGQPVLRKVAEDITPDYPELKELINNMYETLDSSNGIGLAAPQIGLAIRLVVIDLDVLSDDLPEYKGFRHAFINPLHHLLTQMNNHFCILSPKGLRYLKQKALGSFSAALVNGRQCLPKI